MRGDRLLGLTRKEFGVLEVLAASPGAVVSSEELLERVWDDAADPFTNAIRITVMTLRRKLGDPPFIGDDRWGWLPPIRAAGVKRPQPTVRLRLTILYGTLFLVTGMLLLALTYGLLTHNLHGRRDGTGGNSSGQQSSQDHQGNQNETGSDGATPGFGRSTG